MVAIRDGKVVYQRAFGRRSIDNADSSRDKPADGKTLYRIASVSKLVTTLGALKLVEEGKLALDADIGGYLDYAVRNPHFPDTPITLRMLLTHTSSLRDDAGYYRWGKAGMQDFLVPGGSAYGSGAMWSREAPPGAYFSYANLPWGVVGTIMEKVSGERFDRLMKRLILDPLGLEGGYNAAEIPAQCRADIATLYRKATPGDTQVWDPRGPWIAQADDYSTKAPGARSRPRLRDRLQRRPLRPAGRLTRLGGGPRARDADADEFRRDRRAPHPSQGRPSTRCSRANGRAPGHPARADTEAARGASTPGAWATSSSTTSPVPDSATASWKAAVSPRAAISATRTASSRRSRSTAPPAMVSSSSWGGTGFDPEAERRRVFGGVALRGAHRDRALPARDPGRYRLAAPPRWRHRQRAD